MSPERRLSIVQTADVRWDVGVMWRLYRVGAIVCARSLQAGCPQRHQRCGLERAPVLRRWFRVGVRIQSSGANDLGGRTKCLASFSTRSPQIRWPRRWSTPRAVPGLKEGVDLLANFEKLRNAVCGTPGDESNGPPSPAVIDPSVAGPPVCHTAAEAYARSGRRLSRPISEPGRVPVGH